MDSEVSFREAKFVVVGAPLDATGTFRPGYRYAPFAIRSASSQIETYSWRFSFDAGRSLIHDLGDLAVGSDVGRAVQLIEESVSQIRAASKIPLVLGGEHTVTLGSFLGSHADRLIVFDAHTDLRDEYQGIRLSHATWLRRLSERVPRGRILVIGGRATSSDELASRPHDVRVIRWSGVGSVSSDLSKWAGDGSGCYLSIDLDFFDPAYAPGVGNPEPEGASPAEFFQLLASLEKPRLVGADVVEVVPNLDPSGITSVLASKILVELISLISVKNLTQ